MAIIVSIWNQKGGVGKSTLALNLYEVFRRNKTNVALVDADSQQSVIELVDALDLPVLAVPLSKAGDLNKLADLVIVDTPPYLDSNVIDKILPLSDLVLLPCRPSPPDVLSLQDSIALIPKGVRWASVLTMVVPNSPYVSQIKAQVQSFGSMFDTTIGNRLAFSQGLMLGGIYKAGNSKAVAEIEDLAAEVYNAVSK